jgi:hypothetical protein
MDKRYTRGIAVGSRNAYPDPSRLRLADDVYRGPSRR